MISSNKPITPKTPWRSYAAFKMWKQIQEASRKVLGLKGT
jgi:hypothetical protein